MSDATDVFAEYDEVFEYDAYDDDEVPETEFQAERYLRQYEQLFSRTAFNHDDLAWGSFHMLLGSLNNIRTIRVQKGDTILDPRIHIFYIAASASGKGAATNFIQKCGTAAGLVFQSCGAITANALTGTQEKMDKPKAKHGDEPLDHERYKMSEGYLNPEVMPSHVCFFTEAAELVTVKPSPDMRKCLDHFQKAMNPLGTEDNRISKKTALGPEITFFPNTSLFFTTYNPVELAEVITQRGFLQRCLFLIREASLDDRFEDLKKVIHAMDTVQSDVSEIVNLFKRIDAFYGENNIKHLTIDRSVLPSVEAHILSYKRILLNCNDYIQEKLTDFIPRFHDIYWKLAMHSCILRLGKEIGDEDIAYAHMYTKSRFQATLEYLTRTIPVPAEVKRREIERFTNVRKTFDALKNHYNEDYFDIDAVQKVLVKNRYFATSRDALSYLYRLCKMGYGELQGKNMKLIKRTVFY